MRETDRRSMGRVYKVAQRTKYEEEKKRRRRIATKRWPRMH